MLSERRQKGPRHLSRVPTGRGIPEFRGIPVTQYYFGEASEGAGGAGVPERAYE